MLTLVWSAHPGKFAEDCRIAPSLAVINHQQSLLIFMLVKNWYRALIFTAAIFVG